MKFKKFDYQNPPANGVYWLDFAYPETESDADDEGKTVGCYTGEVVHKLGLAFIDNIDDNGQPFQAMPVDRDLCNIDGELATIGAYALAAVPELPELSPVGFKWFEHTGTVDESRFGATRWFWVAVRNEEDESRYVTLAYHELRDGQEVAGFDSPEYTYFPLHELYAGDTVTHIAPLEIPVHPIRVEVEPVESEEDLRHSVTLLTYALSKLRDIGTGQLAHAYNGKCPDLIEGASTRDEQCPACIELIKADAALNATVTPIAPR